MKAKHRNGPLHVAIEIVLDRVEILRRSEPPAVPRRVYVSISIHGKIDGNVCRVGGAIVPIDPPMPHLSTEIGRGSKEDQKRERLEGREEDKSG